MQQLILDPEPVRRDEAPLPPHLRIRVVAAGPAGRGRVEVVGREREPDTHGESALQVCFVAGEVPVASGDGHARARGHPVVPAGEEMDLEESRPALHLDPVEEADGEERRVHGETVEAGRHVGHAVEVVVGGGGAAPLEVHQLRPAGEPAAPEIDTRHLREQVAHGGAVHPFDRVASEDDTGERGPGPRRGELGQYRHPDLLQLQGAEVAGGVVDRVGQRVGAGGVVEDLGPRVPGDDREADQQDCHDPRGQRAPEPCRPRTNSLNRRTPIPVGPLTRVASSRSV
jgi:hypothetical protein